MTEQEQRIDELETLLRIKTEQFNSLQQRANRYSSDLEIATVKLQEIARIVGM